MKRLSALILFTCACIPPIAGQAQVNYVLNPSFEQYSLCPPGPDYIRLAIYWGTIDTVNISPPLCSAEYCNACDTSYGYGMPYGSEYFQYARSGNGMVEAQMYFDNSGSFPYYRDYVQGRLYKALTNGKTYCVTFYVNLTEASEYAINRIGAYIDNGSIDMGQDSVGCAAPQTAFIPQIVDTTIINDTLNWVKVQGSFVANGTERFITIGNFSDINHTDTVKLHPHSADNYSWYLIDDVSVIASDAVANAGPDVGVPYGDSVHIGTSDEGMPCTWYKIPTDIITPIGYSGGIWVKPDSTTTYVVMMDLCGHVTYDTVVVTVWLVGVASPGLPKGEEVLRVWPNPVSNELTISNGQFDKLTVTDIVSGSARLTMTIKKEKEVIDVTQLPPGVYIVQIVEPSTGYKVVKKVVKE